MSNNYKYNSQLKSKKSYNAFSALGRLLCSYENKSYGYYKSLNDNVWDYNNSKIGVTKIQSDPYAPSSIFYISIPQTYAKFPSECFSSNNRIIATGDYLHRRLYSFLKACPDVYICKPSQCYLPRNTINLNNNMVTCFFNLPLPAKNGRRIFGTKAANIFEKQVYPIINHMIYTSIDKNDLNNHIHCYLDQIELREKLTNDDCIGFVKNGAILPRESGNSDLKLTNAVPFKSPDTLNKSYKLTYCGNIEGMAIPKGITLIVGGGFHGKSTLMNALQKGIYNHIAGDGREFVVCNNSAASIKAEDGRNVSNVDISPFINNLPGGINTNKFSTTLASGSTSQATNIMESLEIGSKLLLIDEDKTATNFMCRDRFMSKLISDDKEPIYPFITKAQALFKEYNVSIILVIGGLGEYFSIADNIIMMDNYTCKDVTQQTKDIIANDSNSILQPQDHFGNIIQRIPLKKSWSPLINNRIRTRSCNTISIGNKLEIDISSIDFEEESQVSLVSYLLQYIAKNSSLLDKTLKEIVEHCEDNMNEDHYFKFCKRNDGRKIIPFFQTSLSGIRKYELAAVINRYRNLLIKQAK